MAEGGGLKDIWGGVRKGVSRFARKVWAWGHNDQRASWLMHAAVAALGTQFIHDVLGIHESDTWGATVMLVFYGLRELGDAYSHRRKKEWRRLNRDVNWRGKVRRGVNPAYDGWADFIGPLGVWLGTDPVTTTMTWPDWGWAAGTGVLLVPVVYCVPIAVRWIKGRRKR